MVVRPRGARYGGYDGRLFGAVVFQIGQGGGPNTNAYVNALPDSHTRTNPYPYTHSNSDAHTHAYTYTNSDRNPEAKEERAEESDKYLLRERRAGAFYRAVRLPETVDAERAQAHYDRGVLTVTFPKAEGKKAHRIAVEVNEASAIEG